jgi:hypothetical protein
LNQGEIARDVAGPATTTKFEIRFSTVTGNKLISPFYCIFWHKPEAVIQQVKSKGNGLLPA